MIFPSTDAAIGLFLALQNQIGFRNSTESAFLIRRWRN
jgi:hypothetical protein